MKAKAKKATTAAKVTPVVEEVKAPVAEATVETVEVKEEVKAEVKEEVKAETKAAKKAPVKKAEKKEEVKAEVKEEKKETAKKATTKKSAVKPNIVLQFAGKAYTEEELMTIAKDVWKYDLNGKEADLKAVDLYVKPEDNVCYYVFNGNITGSFAI